MMAAAQTDAARVEAAARRAQATAADAFCAYLYDLDILQRHAAAMVSALPQNCELFYAVKANSDAPLLRTLAPLVAGFEVASGGELTWLRRHLPHAAVVFGGPGKTDAELAAALALDVQRLHVESPWELQRLGVVARAAGRTAQVLLRVNMPLDPAPATPLAMGGRPTAFGIDVEHLPACLAWLRSHPEVRLRGFHFHLVSQHRDAAAHLRLLALYFQRVRQWRHDYGLDLDEVNVGGGFGVNYCAPQESFDWKHFSGGLQDLIRRTGMADWRIRLEPGRYVSAACGYYVMEVLDIKQVMGRSFVIGRGGTHHFRTPFAQGHSHPFRVLPVAHWPYAARRPELRSRSVTVVGQLCTPKDVLAEDAFVERVRVGDLLLFPYAGAYAWHISHHDFLRHPQPLHLYLPAEDLRHAAGQ